MDQIQVREATADDQSFILATWLNHYWHNSPLVKPLRKSIFFPNHELLVKRILARSGVSTLIAHERDEPEVILGFLVSEQDETLPTIHFIFVQKELRKLGIGRRLVQAAEVDPTHCYFTHWTYLIDAFVQKHQGMIYHPYLT